MKTYLDRISYRVFQFIKEQGLIAPNDKILVSISGGLDSVSLFCMLLEMQAKLEFELHLVHFHHGIRYESEDEEAFVSQLSRSRGTPLTIVRSDEFKGEKGLQNRARIWRYQNLDRIAKDLNFNKIALGHHLDDLVETQIWKLTRGTSLYGLNPIQAKNFPYIRPLLETPKKSLKEYLLNLKQDWKEDQTNFENNYTRNLIRNEIIPLLNQCAGGKLNDKLLAISHDAQYLNQLFEEVFPPQTYQVDTLSYQRITSQNKLLACELIHRFLLHHRQNEIPRENIERIYQLVLSGKGNWQLFLKNRVRIKSYQKELSIKNNDQ